MHLLARKDTIEERLGYCNFCENNKFGVCNKCGCIVKAKVRFSNQNCPIKLWEAELQDLKPLISKFLNPN